MATTQTADATAKAQRGLTLWPATALVTGTIIGAGIFTQPTWLAQYGPISIVGFAFTAIGSMMLALVFASLARRTPDVGGPYAFSRQGFGDFIGFQSAWTYWIGAWVGVGAIASSFLVYLGDLIPVVSDNHVLGTAHRLAPDRHAHLHEHARRCDRRSGVDGSHGAEDRATAADRHPRLHRLRRVEPRTLQRPGAALRSR